MVQSGFIGVASSAAKIPVLSAQKEVRISLPVVTGHQHINQRIDTGGHVDQQVAKNIPRGVVCFDHSLENGYGQVAKDKGAKNYQNHPQQLPVLIGHFAPLVNNCNGGAGRVTTQNGGCWGQRGIFRKFKRKKIIDQKLIACFKMTVP